MRFVVMTACVAVMACLQSAPAQAQMMPWGTWETRYGSGSMFTSYGPSYYTGYAPVYYTAAYGPSYYNGGCCGIASPCSGGACGGCSSCGSGGCGAYSAGYGYDCGCGTGCCDGCAGGCSGCGGTGCSNCGGAGCSNCGGAGCSGGNCANCVGTSSGSNMTPTPDNNRPAGPQPTPAAPARNPETDNFNPRSNPAGGVGTFGGNNGTNPSSIPGNTPPNNTNPANNWSQPAPASNIDLGPSGGTPRVPAAGEPGGGAAPAYTPPGTSIPSGDRFNNPGANTPASGEFTPPGPNNFNPANPGNPANEDGIRSFKPDTSSIHYIDGPIAHRYEARRLRSQLATASKPLKVSRVAVQDVAAPSEQIASNR